MWSVEGGGRGGESGDGGGCGLGEEEEAPKRSRQMKGCSHRRVSTRVVVDLTCGWVGCVLQHLRVRGIDGCVLEKTLCAQGRSQVCSDAGCQSSPYATFVGGLAGNLWSHR